MHSTQKADLDIIKKAWNFHAIRQLEDGTVVAFGPLIFTVAIYIDVYETGWSKRFCFDDAGLAKAQFESLISGDQEPQGWIARRPQI